MRVGNFDLTVVQKGTEQRLPEVEGSPGQHFVVAEPGQAFDGVFTTRWMPPNTDALLVELLLDGKSMSYRKILTSCGSTRFEGFLERGGKIALVPRLVGYLAHGTTESLPCGVQMRLPAPSCRLCSPSLSRTLASRSPA